MQASASFRTAAPRPAVICWLSARQARRCFCFCAAPCPALGTGVAGALRSPYLVDLLVLLAACFFQAGAGVLLGRPKNARHTPAQVSRSSSVLSLSLLSPALLPPDYSLPTHRRKGKAGYSWYQSLWVPPPVLPPPGWVLMQLCSKIAGRNVSGRSRKDVSSSLGCSRSPFLLVVLFRGNFLL
jgi:hypothetical protein